MLHTGNLNTTFLPFQTKVIKHFVKIFKLSLKFFFFSFLDKFISKAKFKFKIVFLCSSKVLVYRASCINSLYCAWISSAVVLLLVFLAVLFVLVAILAHLLSLLAVPFLYLANQSPLPAFYSSLECLLSQNSMHLK